MVNKRYPHLVVENHLKYGKRQDKHGYAPSIIQTDLSRCFWCGRSGGKLDRHEVFGASNRSKSKRLGLWVMLCHDECHINGVHAHKEISDVLKRKAQAAAMKAYNWMKEDFIREFGRNYLED